MTRATEQARKEKCVGEGEEMFRKEVYDTGEYKILEVRYTP